MNYPGRLIQVGEGDATIVNAIIDALNARGINAGAADGRFDAALRGAVMQFQSLHVDNFDRPLRIDGRVGPLTWEVLFPDSIPSAPVGSGLGVDALDVALGQVGQMEQPLGSNRGPQVDVYQRAVGLPLTATGPGFYWCMAFVVWCFQQAAAQQGVATPFPRTAECLVAWNRVRKASPTRVLTRADAIAEPQRVRPGMVFIHDYGGGAGHTGFVEAVSGAALKTVEGNSNPAGSSNGIGVFRLNRRSVMDPKLKGFIDFT